MKFFTHSEAANQATCVLAKKSMHPYSAGGRGYIFCLLSGRYPTTNRLGIVFLQRVLQNLMVPWNIFSSTALHKTCTKMYNLFHNVSTESDKLSTVVNIVLQSDNQQLRMQFYSIVPTQLLGKHVTDSCTLCVLSATIFIESE